MEPSRRERAQDRAENVLFATLEIVRDSVTNTIVERFTRPKYNDAVRVALDVVDTRITALKAKAKPTQKDTQTLDLLKEIKSEMEREFDKRWEDREGRKADWVQRSE
jgi:hypothetical protein